MVWIQGDLAITIAHDGSIDVDARALNVRDGPPPVSLAASGADPMVLAAIRHRTPGAYGMRTFLGGATATLVPTRALRWLDARSMKLIRAKHGELPEVVCVMLVRDSAAPAAQNAAEPTGGVAESTDLFLEQVREIVEVGVYRDDGWMRFLLPEHLRAYQHAFDEEQQAVWSCVRPGFPQQHTAPLAFLPYGKDRFLGRQCVVTTGAVSNVLFLSIARLELPVDGAPWRLCDMECRPGIGQEPPWVPLRRTVVIVMPRDGRSPLLMECAPDGGVHPCGIHVPLSHEALDVTVTDLGRATVEVLGWTVPHTP